MNTYKLLPSEIVPEDSCPVFVGFLYIADNKFVV